MGGMKIIVPSTASPGVASCIAVDLHDEQDGALPGIQPLRVTVTDPSGAAADISDYYAARQGALRIAFTPALNDPAGKWNIKVEDLTAGLSAEASFTLAKQ
jgi:hypothetical protein